MLQHIEGDEVTVGANTEPDTTNQEEDMSPSQNLTLRHTKNHVTAGLERLLNGPLAQNNSELMFRQGRTCAIEDSASSKSKGTERRDNDDKENGIAESYASSRSKTMPTLGRMKISRQKVLIGTDGERLRNAKETVERAIKYKKVFTIQGGYSTIRHSLRRRGWVEKFYKIPSRKRTPLSKKRKNSDDDENEDDDVDDDDTDDDTDDDNDQPRIPPWEENDGIYGIMSRMVRNVNPSFFWVLKRDAIDYRYLNKEQMVNHYCKAGSFTTKVGLYMNMKNVTWFNNSDQDTFFPRCYRLSNDEDKLAFVDDYRLTACMSIIKVALYQHPSVQDHRGNTPHEQRTEENQIRDNTECTQSRPDSNESSKCMCPKEEQPHMKTSALFETGNSKISEDEGYPVIHRSRKKKKKKVIVPTRVLETAVYQCEKFLASKLHEDIDMPGEIGQLTDGQWDNLMLWYYELVHEEGTFTNIHSNLLAQCERLLQTLGTHWPQLGMDGTRNVWIVKPGAKSRGRGIVCYEKLEDMLKLVSSQVVKKDGKYVVQKYIERPLLVYNTKFDIRQWFLVTDWNPLTLWFYQDSYLRFCSQQFTLDDFDKSIHLSNNAIQKNYKNGPRSSQLPQDNMWSHEEFKEYLARKKQPNAWVDIIYPAMKQAVISSLLVTQDIVEYRKSSFELYGADFMLTEDLQPWLIEINSSPSMESSTAITAKLCSAVLDDTIKVVVDRKFDRNCGTGRFELAFKQPLVTVPHYIGISLCVEGQSVRRSNLAVRHSKQADSSDALFNPRVAPLRQTTVDRSIEMRKIIHHTPMGSSSVGATVGGGQEGGHQGKKENFRIHNATTAKSTVNIPSPSNKDSTSKINGSRSQTEACHDKSPSTKNSVNTGSNNAPHSPPLSKKTPFETDGGEQSGEPCLRVQNGVIPPTARVLPNTPYMAGLNQRRYVSKTSLSTNYTTIPLVPGTDKNNAKLTVSVNNVEPADLQTFKPIKGDSVAKNGDAVLNPWLRSCPCCGRGSNLHLDSADPNCRCQKDSILVISLNTSPLNDSTEMSTSNNNKHSLGKMKKPRSLKVNRRSKRNAISVTPNYQARYERPNDGTESYSPNVDCMSSSSMTIPDRSGSAHNVDLSPSPLKKTISASKHNLLRKSTGTMNHIPPDNVFNPKYHYSHEQQQYQDSPSFRSQNNTVYNICGGWQTLMNKQCSHLHPYSTDAGSKRLQGSTYTTRVKNIITQKSSPNSINRLWPNLAYEDSQSWFGSLSVVAQRRLKIKH